MAAAARPRSPPSGVVLERSVALEAPPAGLEQEWAIVECAKKTAYGCGDHGQMVVDGLTLHARLVSSPDLTSALYIHLNDDALRGIQAQFGLSIDGPLISIDREHGLYVRGSVVAADERFLIIVVLFRLVDAAGERQYYLVYDAADESLSMIPFLPEECTCYYTLVPVPVPRAHGGGYELLLPAQKRLPTPPEGGCLRYEDVLCAWTPSAAAEEPDDGIGPWRIKGRWRDPEEAEDYFHAEVAFSFQGTAFWVDLSKGIVYHHNVPAVAGNDDPVVECGFIGLPPGCPPDERWTKPKFRQEDIYRMNVDRTMGVVAGAIRFVCIDRRAQQHGDCTVTVWTLDMAGQQQQWTQHQRFRTEDLWRLRGFKMDRLPKTQPRFPILMADGTLCLLLRNKPRRRKDPAEDYICNLALGHMGDMSSMSLLWSGRLHYYHTTDEPLVVPFSFFRTLHLLDPRKSGLRGIFT